MRITVSEARENLSRLVKQVNDDHDPVEIVSENGDAVLMAADDFAALREGAYLFRSPVNVRRLVVAYEHALDSMGRTGRRPL